jgi:hypothetical protein
MSEFEQDPSANTGRFRAFVERGQAEDQAVKQPIASRGLMIGGAVALVIIVIVVIALAL